jgi:uncharacterized membrane protein YgdD (TMEM256/DUF423 family)
MLAKTWILVAALLGAGAVTIGAYHAHGLETALAKRGLDAAEIAKQMHNCDVAVKYQMYHALAIFGIGLLAARSLRGGAVVGSIAAGFMLLGVLGFSGGLYAMVFDIAKLHWAVVPLGGLMMILGWVMLAVAGFFVAPEQPDKKST